MWLSYTSFVVEKQLFKILQSFYFQIWILTVSTAKLSGNQICSFLMIFLSLIITI